jgi:4-deoxy-L-threo-5-hexosulose-uronate ketol-isomerase
VEFASASADAPAAFYLLRNAVHTAHPTTLATKIGASDNCNERTIFQFIHEGGIQSCRLARGCTELKTGNGWNAMPCQTHFRRPEVYLYFDMQPGAETLPALQGPIR